jgi:mRNA interferase RelE/StbE
MYKIVVHKRAAKSFKKMSDAQAKNLKSALLKLANNPHTYPGIKKMAGEWIGYWRIRIGAFRVILWLDNEKNIIYIDHIGNRGDVYKN